MKRMNNILEAVAKALVKVGENVSGANYITSHHN